MIAPYIPESERVARFSAVYLEELALALREYPADYAWPAEELPAVHGRMMSALVAGRANKDSPPIKATCKRLGIKHTYKALRTYFEGKGIES